MTAEVYRITTITTHRSTSSGNDLTMNAAINTAITLGIALAMDALRLWAPSRIKQMEAGGIRNVRNFLHKTATKKYGQQTAG